MEEDEGREVTAYERALQSAKQLLHCADITGPAFLKTHSCRQYFRYNPGTGEGFIALRDGTPLKPGDLVLSQTAQFAPMWELADWMVLHSRHFHGRGELFVHSFRVQPASRSRLRFAQNMTRLERVAAGLEVDPYGREAGCWAKRQAQLDRRAKWDREFAKPKLTILGPDMSGDDL